MGRKPPEKTDSDTGVKSQGKIGKWKTGCRKQGWENFVFFVDKLCFLLYNIECRLSGIRYATVAQLVEQLIRNQQVRGSSPLSSFYENP